MVAFENGAAFLSTTIAPQPPPMAANGQMTFQGSAVPADGVTFKVLATVSLNVVRLTPSFSNYTLKYVNARDDRLVAT
jgi:hypothetical protein